MQLPTFLTPDVRGLLGGSLFTIGLIFIVWSIRAQRELGKGTPMPLMATQNLVVQKPYLYCRNPIFFGVINLFFGISILFNSISSLVMVLIFSVIILLYTKLIEEKELETRFGDEYLTYKNRTPFFIPIPKISRRKK
ncbi:MAG: isoprenylcysteine carboxylmethyltransferase family protein [Anaerolineales bacterium]|nr:isoprenylcysteine carboxylmethyltransferase family protein [Anaerolineales bacterium]